MAKVRIARDLRSNNYCFIGSKDSELDCSERIWRALDTSYDLYKEV